MSGSREKSGFDWSFSNESVNERLNAGKEQMNGVGETPHKRKAPRKSGYLDTQLFPDRKPKYHE